MYRAGQTARAVFSSPGRGAVSRRLTERSPQICDCLLPPAAISFPLRGKRYGRKGRLGTRLVRPASDFRQAPMFRASFHTIVTSRASWYAPPDTRGIKFVTSCLRTTAVNRRCNQNLDGYYLLAGQFVGAGLCSARWCWIRQKDGRSRAPPLQGAFILDIPG